MFWNNLVIGRGEVLLKKNFMKKEKKNVKQNP